MALVRQLQRPNYLISPPTHGPGSVTLGEVGRFIESGICSVTTKSVITYTSCHQLHEMCRNHWNLALCVRFSITAVKSYFHFQYYGNALSENHEHVMSLLIYMAILGNMDIYIVIYAP